MEEVRLSSDPTGPEAPEGNQAEADSPDSGGNADLILGKFKSQEDLAKAYKELESKLGTVTADKPAESDAEAETDETEDLTDLDPDALKITEKKAEKAGVDVDAIAAEYRENGEISDKTYKSLEKQGIPKQMVDSYVEGQMALARQSTAELAKMVGGTEALGEMLEWAADSLSPEEVAAYNKTLEAGDLGATKMALRGVAAAYREANGSEPTFAGAAESATRLKGVPPFSSQEAMVNAMMDNRYKDDPDFRAEVQRRIEASDF